MLDSSVFETINTPNSINKVFTCTVVVAVAPRRWAVSADCCVPVEGPGREGPEREGPGREGTGREEREDGVYMINKNHI